MFLLQVKGPERTYISFQFVKESNCVYLRVKLAVNQATQEAVAVKIVDITGGPQVSTNVKKEVIFLTQLFKSPLCLNAIAKVIKH